MADTLIDPSLDTVSSLRSAPLGPYWSDESTAVVIYADGALDITFSRTTDKGATWAKTEILIGSTVQIACWYDKETPGNTGTLLHIVWVDAISGQNIYYQTLDVATGNLGTRRIIDDTISVGGNNEHRIAITQAVNGNLIVAFSTNTDIECYRSTDSGVNWTSRADVFETASENDWCLLFPADVDAGDVAAIFWDRSANTISLKMYDDSANSWTEINIDTDSVASPDHMHMDGSLRLSDKHILLAAHSSFDNTTDDLRTYDLTVDSIASPTVTDKTNVFTNQVESGQVSVFINQQNNNVYIAYIKGGTWQDTTDVVFHKSTDGMAVWGTEQVYSEATADDIRTVSAGRTVGNDGGRYQPAFYNDDLRDLFVNEVNDVEIAAAAAPTFRPHIMSY